MERKIRVGGDSEGASIVGGVWGQVEEKGLIKGGKETGERRVR